MDRASCGLPRGHLKSSLFLWLDCIFGGAWFRLAFLYHMVSMLRSGYLPPLCVSCIAINDNFTCDQRSNMNLRAVMTCRPSQICPLRVIALAEKMPAFIADGKYFNLPISRITGTLGPRFRYSQSVNQWASVLQVCWSSLVWFKSLLLRAQMSTRFWIV